MKVCPICTAEYSPKHSQQSCCGDPICKAELKRQRAIKRESWRNTRKRKDALKTKSDWLKEAQVEFNKFIRLRDRDLPCISCGRFHDGAYDAGHYRSVGAAPQLRFNEDNCHKQCVPCNQYKSGNAIEYRIRLIERIGEERVAELESSSALACWTVDDIKAIKEKYREKCKELKKEIK